MEIIAKIMLAVSDHTKSSWREEKKVKFPYPQLDDPFENLIGKDQEGTKPITDEQFPSGPPAMINAPRRAILGRPPGLLPKPSTSFMRDEPAFQQRQPVFNEYAHQFAGPAHGRRYPAILAPPPWKINSTSRYEEEMKTKKMRENDNPRTHRSYHY